VARATVIVGNEGRELRLLAAGGGTAGLAAQRPLGQRRIVLARLQRRLGPRLKPAQRFMADD